MKKRIYSRDCLALDIVNTLIIIMYFALVIIYTYSGLKTSGNGIIMLLVIMLGMIFGYYTDMLSSLVFSMLVIFVYSSYTIFLNIAKSIQISSDVYFWVIAIPLFCIVSGYRGQIIRSLQNENALLQKDNVELVSIDKETGLKNIQLLYDELQSHMNISRRYGVNVYLMVIEIQYKSEIIRAFGRTTYNEIIKELSTLIDKFLRYEDKKFFMRESDKFGVVFLSKPEGGREVKKRVKKAIEIHEFKREGALNKIRFQASVGLYEYDPNTDITPYDFLRLAEKDMEYDV